jgi:hypothetical protein
VITSILSLTALSENAGGATAAKASHIVETSSKRFMPRLRFIDEISLSQTKTKRVQQIPQD